MDLWLSIGPSMVFFAVFHLLIKHVLYDCFHAFNCSQNFEFGL